MTRKYTNRLLEMVEQGTLDAKLALKAALGHMTEAEVQSMAESNEFVECDELDDHSDSIIDISPEREWSEMYDDRMHMYRLAGIDG